MTESDLLLFGITCKYLPRPHTLVLPMAKAKAKAKPETKKAKSKTMKALLDTNTDMKVQGWFPNCLVRKELRANAWQGEGLYHVGNHANPVSRRNLHRTLFSSSDVEVGNATTWIVQSTSYRVQRNMTGKARQGNG